MHVPLLFIKNGNLWIYENGVSQKITLGKERNVVAINQGNNQNFILESGGECWYSGLNIFDFDYFDNFRKNTNHGFAKIKTPNKFKFVVNGTYGSVLAVDINDKYYAVGSNDNGELGFGDTQIHFDKWKKGKNDKMFVQISCGDHHTVALDKKNIIWGCGWNTCGNLGITSIFSSKFRKFRKLSNTKFSKIACGNTHTMALDLNGNVWGCGDNSFGQLGLGDDNNRFSLTRLCWSRRFEYISCGRNHTILIDIDGNVWSAGDNTYGQLGNPNSQHYDTRIIFSKLRNFQNVFEQVFKNQSRVISAYCREDNTFILTECRNIWCCGYNGGHYEHEMNKNFYDFKLIVQDSVSNLPNEPFYFSKRPNNKSAMKYL